MVRRAHEATLGDLFALNNSYAFDITVTIRRRPQLCGFGDQAAVTAVLTPPSR